MIQLYLQAYLLVQVVVVAEALYQQLGMVVEGEMRILILHPYIYLLDMVAVEGEVQLQVQALLVQL